MTEEPQNLSCLSFFGPEADFATDNHDAIQRLISILAELQSGIVTLDLQAGILIACNVTKREHFVG